jgi:acyl-CoA synthetase (AMP-forming)/AMP-acid ligase II
VATPTADFVLADLPAKGARHWPGRAAFVQDGRATTYAEFDDRVGRLARLLAAGHTGKGSRVGILADNSPAFYELFFACARIGAVLVPVNVRLSPGEVEYQVADAGMTHAFIGPGYAALAEQSGLASLTTWELDAAYESALTRSPASAARLKLSGQAPLVQMYTSGTTGLAKGCIHSHRGWLASALNFALGLRLARHSVVYASPPLFHAFGFGLGLSHLVTGGTLVIAGNAGNDVYWAAVDEYRVNTASFPRGLPPDQRDRPYLRTVFGQAGSYRPQMGQVQRYVLPRAEYFGVYGLTEATNIVFLSTAAEERAHPGTLGQPLPGIDAQVVRPDGSRTEPGETGELVLRGPQLSLGYWNNPQATADLFAGGWLHTGDLARCDSGGRVYFEDRARDMIKSGGENVYSAEV